MRPPDAFRYKTPLPQYGYSEPVRVCSECYGLNNPNTCCELIDNLSFRNTNSMVYEALAELSVPRIVISPRLNR